MGGILKDVAFCTTEWYSTTEKQLWVWGGE